MQISRITESEIKPRGNKVFDAWIDVEYELTDHYDVAACKALKELGYHINGVLRVEDVQRLAAILEERYPRRVVAEITGIK